MAWCSSDRLGALRVSGKRRDEGLRPHIGTTSPLGRGPFHAADDAVLCARTLDSHGASARCRSLSRRGAHRHAGERGARRPEPDAAWARWLVGVWRSSSISRSSIDTRNDTILPCTSGPDLMRCRVCASCIISSVHRPDDRAVFVRHSPIAEGRGRRVPVPFEGPQEPRSVLISKARRPTRSLHRLY